MAAFTQFDNNGFLRVGTRDVEKALGDTLINAIRRSEKIRENLDKTVNDAKSSLLNLVPQAMYNVIGGGLLKVIEELEDTTSAGKGLHVHQGLYYAVSDWPSEVLRGVPVTLGPEGGPAIIPATWDSPSYLGISSWFEASEAIRRGRVITAGTIVGLPLEGFSPGDVVYVGEGPNAPLASFAQVPQNAQLIPVGVYLGRNVLKLVSAPATLKTA